MKGKTQILSVSHQSTFSAGEVFEFNKQHGISIDEQINFLLLKNDIEFVDLKINALVYDGMPSEVYVLIYRGEITNFPDFTKRISVKPQDIVSKQSVYSDDLAF